ncbi:MAG: hypothetical protein AAFO03_03300 [Bacteroidota bacterium]
MSREKIVLQSATAGIWARMISQLFSYWFGGYWFVSVVGWLVATPTLFYLLFLVALSVVTYYSYQIISDHPYTWKKEVAFDFAERQITVLKMYGKDTTADILDAPQRTIDFDHIDRLMGRPYESFLFPSVYRITVMTKGEEVKLLALRSPNEYTNLMSQFQRSGILVS